MGPVPALLAILVAGAGDAPAAGTTPAAPTAPGPTIVVPPAPVEDLPIAISWDAPAECPGIDAVKQEVRRVAVPSALLGTDAIVPIQLTVDRAIVPAQIPGSGSTDSRALGVRVLDAFLEAR